MTTVGLSELFFQCPYCGERVSILVDETARKQSYIEDCEVCCRPIEFTLRPDLDGKFILDASRID